MMQPEIRAYLEFGDGLAVGPDESGPRLAAGLELDRQLFTGLLAREFDRGAPLMIGVQEVDRRGLLGVETVQFEPAVMSVDEVVLEPR